MRFWLARLMGISANQMLMLGIAWHMYDITGSAWDLGLVGLFQFIPALLMALPAGQLIDRLHRGRIRGLVRPAAGHVRRHSCDRGSDR